MLPAQHDHTDYTLWVVVFLLLGIERVLYGYVYHFPQHFKECCQRASYGSWFQQEPICYWKICMQLGVYIKTIQFSVVVYDLTVRCSIRNPFTPQCGTWSQVLIGPVLIMAGQGLNMMAFRTLGAMGIYYGMELGYNVHRTTSFPYNLGLSHPQYYGVLASIWGLYITLSASSFVVPCLETFWYLMSMWYLERTTEKDLLILQASSTNACTYNSNETLPLQKTHARVGLLPQKRTVHLDTRKLL
jgi:hypothetical protein